MNQRGKCWLAGWRAGELATVIVIRAGRWRVAAAKCVWLFVGQQHTLLSLPSAAIRSAHSLEYSKLRSALSMLVIYWRYFASAMSFCSSKSVSADSMASFVTESIAEKTHTKKKKKRAQLKTTIRKSITINKHLLPPTCVSLGFY